MATFRNSVAAVNTATTVSLQTVTDVIQSAGNATKLLTSYVDTHLQKQKLSNKVELGLYEKELLASSALRLEAVKQELTRYEDQTSLQESLDQIQAMLDK